MIGQVPPSTLDALGPFAVFAALALFIIYLFIKGSIHSKASVPREDYEALKQVVATQADGLKLITESTNELVRAVRHIQKNGGVG